MRGSVESLRERRLILPAAVVFVTGMAWWGRVCAIARLPEPDPDAFAHLAIAKRLLVHPWQLNLHWVWLPGYHYYLGVLFRLGAGAEAVRSINAALVVALSLLLFGYAKARATHPAVPWLSALFCAVAPIVNLLGISAQQETLFAIVVIACAWAIDARRFWLAGLLLTIAAMIRYEAWGAAGLVAAVGAAQWLPALGLRIPPFARAPKALVVVAAPAWVAIFGWLFLQRVASGKWFGSLGELYRFTSGQRAVLSRGALVDALWFPILLPSFLFGLALPLALIGVRRAFRPGFWVPAGIGAFLLLSYLSKGSLGSGRYFDALAPFVCLCAAQGISELAARRSLSLAWLSALTTLCLAALSVCVVAWTFHFHR